MGVATGSWRTARKGGSLEVGGPPARSATFQWLDRPQGIPFSSGRTRTSRTPKTSMTWQAMLPLLASSLTEGTGTPLHGTPMDLKMRVVPVGLFLA